VSLLDKGNYDIIVYPEETYTDSDGNVMNRPSKTGIPTRAMIQLKAQSGTSARRSEQDNEGYETEAVYRMRLPRGFPHVLGAQSSVEWEGIIWSVIGDVQKFRGSRRTSHNDYTIRRT
jgi:hypothetical protein